MKKEGFVILYSKKKLWSYELFKTKKEAYKKIAKVWGTDVKNIGNILEEFFIIKKAVLKVIEISY